MSARWISGEQVTCDATANRNFTALASLGLGVSSNLPNNNAPSASATSSSIEVNGLRESHNICCWMARRRMTAAPVA